MSAEIINIYSTSKETPHFKKHRFWLELFTVVDLGNDMGMMPLISCKDNKNELVLMFFNTNGKTSVRPKAGEWVKDVMFYTGLKILPLAYTDKAANGRPAIFFEVATVNKNVQFCLNN